jgi:peptide/nickel transport system substrate-binding protein
MPFKLSPRLLIIALVVGALTSACMQPTQGPATSAPGDFPARARTSGVRGGTLTYRVSAPPKTFNYLMATDEPTIIVAFFLTGSRVVEFDHDRQAYVPALAESWQLGADGRTVEVTVRDGLKFSDGQPLTAEDIAFSLRALNDERTASPVYGEAMLIGGKKIEATVTDARHLRFTFPEQIAAPENYLSNVCVLPRHVLEAELNKGTLKDAYGIASDPQQIVTSGPYMVAATTPGERVTLKRNPNYWKRDEASNPLPYLDQIEIVVVTDSSNAVTRLQQNTVDIIDRIRPTDFAALRNGQGAVRALDLGPSLYTDDFWFNLNEGAKDGKPYVEPTKLAWFRDVRFRRAVSHAIDRDSIANNTYQGLASPLYGFIAGGNRAWGVTDLPRTDYNLDAARALLKEAGFTTKGAGDAVELYDAKNNRVEFTLIVSAENELRAKSALVVQEDLARLGIKVNVAPIENTQLQSRINQTFDYEAVLYGTSASEPDPSSYADVLRSSSASHFWYPKEPKPATDWEARLDELTLQQAHEPNNERRHAIFRDIQVLMAEQLPLIPIVTRHIAVAANTRLGNYRPSPLPPFSLWNAEELFMRQ